jgi:hypothetical protein
MKKLILTLALLVCPAFGQINGIADSDPSLVGHWRLGGDTSLSSGFVPSTSTAAYDSSGNGNAGTWSGTKSGIGGTWYGAGHNTGQNAGVFDGLTDKVSFGSNKLPTGAASFSMLAWVNLSSVPAVSNVVINYGIAVINEGRIVSVNTSAGTAYLAFSGYSDDFLSSASVSTGVWHLVGATYAGGTAITVYLDGVGYAGTLPHALNTVNGVQYIGYFVTGALYPFKGSILDARIYNRALSASEMAQLYLPWATVMNIIKDPLWLMHSQTWAARLAG